MKIIAVIPARSGSKGVLDKNIRKLAGKPLIAYSIMAAKRTKFIDRIIVSTDSIKYASLAKKYGAVCTPDFFGYNKNLELQYRGRFKELKDLKAISDHDSDLRVAMKEISISGIGPKDQIPSMGCNIKWFK